MKMVPEQVARFLPDRQFVPLGTDGKPAREQRPHQPALQIVHPQRALPGPVHGEADLRAGVERVRVIAVQHRLARQHRVKDGSGAGHNGRGAHPRLHI